MKIVVLYLLIELVWRLNFPRQTFRPRNVAFPDSGLRKHFLPVLSSYEKVSLRIFFGSRFRVDLDVTLGQDNLCQQDI